MSLSAAKFAEFGGWSMPLEYPSGVVKEHTAVRESVGIFDVSHLGKAMVSGPGAADYVNATLSNDLAKIHTGQGAVHPLPRRVTGGIVDDLIAYWHDDEHVLLVPNAANTAEVVRRLQAAGARRRQGRRPPRRLRRARRPGHPLRRGPRAGRAAGRPRVHVVRRGALRRRRHRGRGVSYGLHRRARLRADRRQRRGRPAVGRADGRRRGVRDRRRADSGSRDTLRTEMGYPLHGQDISLDTNPVEAGLVVGGRLEEGDLLGSRGGSAG